jgi:hypothetical protein
MSRKTLPLSAAAFLFLAVASPLVGAGFNEDFEGTLAQWTGSSGGGGGSGLIVQDPLSSGRGNVLTFGTIVGGGDIFTSIAIHLTGPVEVGFDYLGLPERGGVPGDLGGFLGITYTLTPNIEGVDHFWYASTVNGYPGLLVDLADDGAWHRYSFQLDADAMPAFHLMMEDFIGSGGVAQDVFFDNINVTPVPEPAIMALLGLDLCIGWRSRRS